MTWCRCALAGNIGPAADSDCNTRRLASAPAFRRKIRSASGGAPRLLDMVSKWMPLPRRFGTSPESAALPIIWPAMSCGLRCARTRSGADSEALTIPGGTRGIVPIEWYRSGVLPDGSVIFNYDGWFDRQQPICDPSHPAYLPSYHVEVRRNEVLRLWWEKVLEVPQQEKVKPPSMTREAHIRQILRFRDCQARRRQWLGFWDIADWIACDRGATDRRDEQLRAQGYSDLFDAILAGEFDQRSRSCVLYLAPHPGGNLRLSADLLRQMRDRYAGTMTIYDQVLPRCWVPRDLAQRWFARRDIIWPARFDPLSGFVSRTPASESASPSKAPPDEKAKPTPTELDEWMRRNVKRGDKRDPTIKACCDATHATWREALRAWGRLPDELRLKRGEKR